MRCPFAHEDIGASTRPLLAVDLNAAITAADGDELTAAFAAIPAVTVGVSESVDGNHHERLAAACDILITAATPSALVPGGWVAFEGRDTASLLDEIAGCVEASPIAAVTLAQLLRLSEHATVRDALVAESLAYATLQSGPTFQRWLAARQSQTPAPSSPSVRADRDGDRLDIVLDRPDRHNAFSAAMRDELVTVLRVAATDPSITNVTLRGEGPSFSAGGDLDEFGAVPDAATGHLVRSVRSPAWWMHQLAATVRVHVHGACIGAGIELPAFSNHVVAHPDAFFQLPEVSMGLIPGAGGTASISRRIGRQRTAWLAITSARIDSDRALDWELVDQVRTE